MPRARAVLQLLLPALLGVALQADELNVYAAASLSDALVEAGRAFETDTGHHLLFNLGGSSELARQIRAGAPADVFFSADAAQMDVLERAGLVRATERVELLSNALAVVVPASSEKVAPRSAAELLTLGRLALADPEAVPAGVYARQWLESLGLWRRLAGRVVPTLNVRAALRAVELENVDAGVVYRTDALLSKRVAVAFEVPVAQGPHIVYVLAPLGQPKPAAVELVRYLRSAQAARVFERYGFVLPEHP